MKKIIGLLLFMLPLFVPVLAQNQSVSDGRMKHVTVGSADVVWGISADERVWRWNGTRWEEPTNGRLKQLDASEDGTVWGVSSDDKIWKLQGANWIQIPGALKHVAVANYNIIWGVNATNQVWKWNSVTQIWEQPSPEMRLKQIDISYDGTAWGVGTDDKIWRYTGMGWDQIPGGLKDISVGSSQIIMGTNAADQIWTWKGNTWQQLAPSARLKQVSAGIDGEIWGVNAANQVWKWNGSSWQEVVMAVPQVIVNPGITLFEHSDWNGESLLITGDWDAASNPDWNDRISSIRIPAGYKIQIFEHGQQGGTYKILTSDWTTGFQADFNDIISSIKILSYPTAVAPMQTLQENPVVIAYEHGGFTGASLAIASNWDASSAPDWNDRISSIRVPAGYKIQVFEHTYAGGASMTLTSDWTAASNTPEAFNDFISSIKILAYPTQSQPGVLIPMVLVQQTQMVEPTVTLTAPTLEENCSLPQKQFDNVINAIKSKPFADTKMSTAKLALKGKCISLDQIRAISKQFSFEQQKLEFVKFAYDVTNNKSEYYTLSDAFTFSTTVDEFNKFLEKK